MKIPGANRAFVDAAKLKDYLLSPTHDEGRFKARFFRSLGFRQETWRDLQSIFQKVPEQFEAVEVQETAFGRMFECGFSLCAPNGQRSEILSVWILRPNEDFPRFVTAYPGKANEI